MTIFPRTSLRGFTLIESLLSVALMGLLMGIALPNLEKTWLQSRRQDAQNTLLQLHLKQLHYRGQHSQYASKLTDLGWSNSYSSSGHYMLNLENISSDTYVLHATASGLQVRDTPCHVLSLLVSANAAILRTSNGDANADLGRCWKW
jgi:type IV pilus assembly protein PilE